MAEIEDTIKHITSRLAELIEEAESLKTRIGYMKDIAEKIPNVEEIRYISDLPLDLSIAQTDVQTVIHALYVVERDLEKHEQNR